MDFDIKKKRIDAKKYIIIGSAVFVVVMILVIYAFYGVSRSSDFSVKGKLSAELEDTSISSNETTFLLVGVKNTEKEILNARILVRSDDESAVSIQYERPELLSLELLPGESVVRRLTVQGFSRAIRTDYQLFVELIGDNETVLGSEKIILTVKN